MAHEDCLATEEKRWKSTLDGEDDGMIEIREVSNQLQGTHEATGASLRNINCDGKKISFSRVVPVTNQEVFYDDGKIMLPSRGKIKIKGKFRKVPPDIDDEDSRIKRGKKKESDAANGEDWEAEKPVL